MCEKNFKFKYINKYSLTIFSIKLQIFKKSKSSRDQIYFLIVLVFFLEFFHLNLKTSLDFDY